MRDEIAQRAEETETPLSLTPRVDAIHGTEPLAVPLGRITSTLRRHVWVMAAVFVIGVGGTSVVVRMMPKQFTAAATILVQPQRTQVSDLQAISSNSTDVNSLIRTQMDLLRSPALAASVVKQLNLTTNAEFAPTNGGLMAKVKELMQKIRPHHVVPAPQLSEDDKIQIAGAILTGKLGFTNEARSSVLSVSVTTEDPQLSARIANEVSNQFLDFKRQEKFAAMQRAHDWFQDQMGKLSDEVSAADLAVQQYRQQHRLDELPPDDGGGARAETINRQQLNAISGQLAAVSRELALKEGDLTQVQAVISGSAPAELLATGACLAGCRRDSFAD